MGLFIPAWQDKDTKKALAAVASLDSDGALLRAAKYANDDVVALFAVSRIKDELLLERLALSEPRVSVRVAGMALQRITDYRQEFTAILQRLEYEASQGDAPRVTALLSAAMDVTEAPAAFARMLAILEQKERNAYLKHCVKDDDFMAKALLQCIGIFSCSAPEVAAMMWRFSDKVIMKALLVLDEMGVTLSEAVSSVVQALRTREAAIEAVGTANAVSVRQMALERIDDQKALLNIALYNGSSGIRQAAAARLTDREGIIRFIGENPGDVTEALLQKVLRPAPVERKVGRNDKKPSDGDASAPTQALLLKVAINSRERKAREKAAYLITDASDLNVYARHHMSELDEKTVLRLTSQSLLAELACDKYRYQQPVRMAAVSRLTEDERLGQVVWVHTQNWPSEDEEKLVTAALGKIRNQDIIYQAMGLADGFKTHISAGALGYITDTAILLKVALGGSRFAKAAAERIEGEAELKEIVQKTKPMDDVYSVACRKLEDMRIAVLESLGESALKHTALNDPSPRVRAEAVQYIEDQDFLEKHVLFDESVGVRAAASGRLTRWEALLTMIRDCSIDPGTILKRLCSDVFLSERNEIVAAAATYVRTGEEGEASRFANVISMLTGLGMNDVYLQYGGMEYVGKQIEKLLNCRKLEDFNNALSFLHYAYGKSQHCRDALEKLKKRKVSKHDDFVAYCGEDSYSVMVEETIDFV